MQVLANCATSLDGKLATKQRRQVKLSGEEDFARVHRLRQQVDAVVVGVGTVLADDPKLTVKPRHVDGEPDHPLKVILDTRCRTPADCEAIRTRGEVLILCSEAHAKPIPGVDVETIGWDGVDVEDALDVLETRGVESVLVEGGGEVLWSFLSEDLVDRLTVYVAPVVIGGREAPTLADGDGFEAIGDATRLRLDAADRLDDGIVLAYERVGRS